MIFKILVTVALISLVWFGFRCANKWLGSSAVPNESGDVDDDTAKRHIDDLARCPVCETYVEAQGRVGCQRDDCPMTGARR